MQERDKKNYEAKSISAYQSLNVRLTVLFLTASLLPLMIFVIVAVQRSTAALTKSIAEDLEGKSVLVARDIDDFVLERLKDARILSQADVLEGDDIRSIIQYLTEIVEANSVLDDVDIIGLDGRFVASSGVQNEKGELFSHIFPGTDNLFEMTLTGRQGDVFVSEAMELDSGPGLLFLTPITDDSNTNVTAVL